jgi:hypothetical protein
MQPWTDKEGKFRTMQDAAGTQPISRACLVHCNARADTGFALVIVLWWLVLLVFLTSQITLSSHTEGLVAANVRRSTIAEAEADGAVKRGYLPDAYESVASRWYSAPCSWTAGGG